MVRLFPIIYYPNPATFPFAFGSPTDFSDSARSFDNITSVWLLHEVSLQSSVLLVRQVLWQKLGKSLVKVEVSINIMSHIVRHCRTFWQGKSQHVQPFFSQLRTTPKPHSADLNAQIASRPQFCTNRQRPKANRSVARGNQNDRETCIERQR